MGKQEAKNMDESVLRRLFTVGLQFELSSKLLGRYAISKAVPNANSLPVAANVPAIPSVVCGAFALELHLKCLIGIETGKEPRRGHNLRELLESTSESSQIAVRDAYSQLLDEAPDWTGPYKEAGISLAFDDVLNDCKDAFIEWRYHHEFEKKKAWLAEPLLRAVREVILKLRPEWKALIS